jgi:hypothetical protein
MQRAGDTLGYQGFRQSHRHCLVVLRAAGEGTMATFIHKRLSCWAVQAADQTAQVRRAMVEQAGSGAAVVAVVAEQREAVAVKAAMA